MSPVPILPIVAVDCDEVLAQFTPAIAQYHNETHGTQLKLEDFHSYSFCEVWGGTAEDTIEKVYEFFKSPHFLENLQPLPGAFNSLQSLKSKFRFVLVTSRQHIIQDATWKWIEMHFPGIFEDILFGNHWTKDSPDPTKMDATKRTKLEMCQAVGAIAIIDDSLLYAQQCASELEKVVLFGEYGWNSDSGSGAPLPSNVIRAKDWTQAHAILSNFADLNKI
mmetsp:Transcript_31332/g.43457  ORF Transcript_31332/g.43457 Transcript_31332/m.43457 type:complete len:221 (+) Transcript_31332:98-760(+)